VQYFKLFSGHCFLPIANCLLPIVNVPVTVL
jgi:hypothetical protein